MPYGSRTRFQAAVLISIWLYCLGAGFCIFTLSTPLEISALTFSDLTRGSKLNRARKRAEASLQDMIILILFFAFIFLLATNSQEVVSDIK